MLHIHSLVIRIKRSNQPGEDNVSFADYG